jgi:hypothetical protein
MTPLITKGKDYEQVARIGKALVEERPKEYDYQFHLVNGRMERLCSAGGMSMCSRGSLTDGLRREHARQRDAHELAQHTAM